MQRHILDKYGLSLLLLLRWMDYGAVGGFDSGSGAFMPLSVKEEE